MLYNLGGLSAAALAAREADFDVLSTLLHPNIVKVRLSLPTGPPGLL